MKLSVSREAFLARLGVAARGVSTRSSIQTLSGVRIGEADGGGIELQATDMEIGIRVKVDAEVESAANPIVLPGRLLLDVVRSLPNDDLALEYRTQTQDVEIVSGTAKFHIRTLPTEDFPKLQDRDGAPSISVPAKAFIDTVTRVGRAASRDEARPHLTGVLVSASGNELRMVATDSYRLAVEETQLESALSGDLEVNVPVRALQELTRIAAADGVEHIEVTAKENQVIFQAGDVVLSSRLIEGRFPNYKQLLPETYEHELRLSRAELLDVVKRISLMAQKNAPLRMKFEDGALEVSAETPDIGEARESLPAPFKGETLEIGFNPEFLQDGLDSAESDELIFKLISPHRPGLIQSGDEGGFIYLVMPVRLNV
jgi:DNA polymerase III subunit beta